MALMIAAGMACGTLLGWSFYTSLFLGGMLAISSTTIIVKAFDELGLKGKKFTELVFGALVIEDIVGIFLMVFLSTIAVGSAVDGGEVALKISQMALYLVIWFVLSIIIVPTVLKKVANALNDEIMLIVSIALCLGMVVLANAIGFSAALGAFLAGSILAGTAVSYTHLDVYKRQAPYQPLPGASNRVRRCARASAWPPPEAWPMPRRHRRWPCLLYTSRRSQCSIRWRGRPRGAHLPAHPDRSDSLGIRIQRGPPAQARRRARALSLIHI